MTSLQTYLIIALVSMVVSGSVVWRMTTNYQETKWENVILEKESVSNKVLRDTLEQVRQIEKQHALITTQLEIKNGQLKEQIDSIYTENRRLTRDLNGMRDPGVRATRCAVPTASPTASGSDDQTTGARLSDEASEFLLTFANDSDKVALYAQTCYKWISKSESH